MHPRTGKWEEAEWIDDYFGRHRYGIRFPSDGPKGEVYDERDYEFETRS